MADHYEVVTQAPGFGSKLINSFKGILLGIVLLVVAFPILWWGEGRQDLSKFVKDAVLVPSDTAPAQPAGTLIKTTGTIVSDEMINDEKYLRPPTTGEISYLKLNRSVEMFSWHENKKTEKRGDKEVTTYDYKKDWTSSPTKTEDFHDGLNHKNPPMAEMSTHFQVSSANIGVFPFIASEADFYGNRDLPLKEDMKKPDTPSVLQIEGNSIYIPAGIYAPPGAARDETLVPRVVTNPQIGDLRLSYTYFPNNVSGSVVGDWDGQSIAPHAYQETNTYLGAFAGSLTEFQARLHSDYRTTTWIIRIGSFLLMWLGMQLMLGPLLLLLEYIPIIGVVGRITIAFACGVLAFILWFLTLVLANLWLVLLVFGLLIGGLLFYLKTKKTSTSSTGLPPGMSLK